MARKLVLKADTGEIWIIDVDDESVQKLEGAERDEMDASLASLDSTSDNVVNAILGGGDMIGADDATGHDKMML